MSGNKEAYVKSLTSLLESGADVGATLKRLKEVMRRRGHLRLLQSVLRATLDALTHRAQMAAPHLTLARETDLVRFEKEAPEATVTYDESLIGGYVLTKDNHRLDKSYKHKLLNWYKSSTTNH